MRQKTGPAELRTQAGPMTKLPGDGLPTSVSTASEPAGGAA